MMRQMIPRLRPAVLLLLAALPYALFAGVKAAFAAKPPAPQRILLGPFGFQGVSTRYLLSGATMLTLNYVDKQHLLVTFGVPRLMERLPGDPPGDEDRVVDAVLLELPSGRELARTEWRFHDIGQYLWDLGGGRFLLRQRATLTTFAPLAQLASGTPFQQHPLLQFARRINSIVVSADHKVLTVETSDADAPEQELAVIPTAPSAPAQPQLQPVAGIPNLLRRAHDPAASVASPAPPVQVEHHAQVIQITFLRLLPTDSPSAPLIASRAGALNLREAVVIPLTDDGYLRSRKLDGTRISLEFSTYANKVTDLGPLETSCSLSPTFVSPSELVVFTCRGSEDDHALSGLNLRGDLLWQLNFNDLQAFPSIVSAIPAGRFALSRTVTSSHIFPGEIPSTAQISFQEVRVFQTYNGKQLLRVMTSPVQRAGQNFALSPDGLAVAVIHDPTDPRAPADERQPSIEIYTLPPPTAADEIQLKAEAALAPPSSKSPIRFATSEVKAVVADAKTGSATTPETSSQSGLVPDSTAIPHRADGSDPSAPSVPRPTYGDIPLPPNRKPPTLYTEPAEGAPGSSVRPDSEMPAQGDSAPGAQPDQQKPPPPRPN